MYRYVGEGAVMPGIPTRDIPNAELPVLARQRRCTVRELEQRLAGSRDYVYEVESEPLAVAVPEPEVETPPRPRKK